MLPDNNFQVIYSTGEDEPVEFFFSALLESVKFDLGLGFFSTSGFRALSIGFAIFINNGGKMRILINDILSKEDKEAIEKGLVTNPDDFIEEKILQDIISLEQTLSKKDSHFFNCISWLISTHRIEIVSIKPISSFEGIAHQKFGVFHDIGKNKIAFLGSANFSQTALFHNLESLSCFKSWTNERGDSARIEYFENLFEKFWTGKSVVAKVLPLNKVKTYINSKYLVSSVNHLLEEESSIISDILKDTRINSKLTFKFHQAKDKYYPSKVSKPHFPIDKTPKDFQRKALEKWVENNYNGFFEMATGTGKTITALNCAIELYRLFNTIKLVILVPTLPLAVQWKEEVESFGIPNIILANSNNPNWIEETLRIINKSLTGNTDFCIITTYSTFSLDKFQSIIKRLKEDTFLIADEAHNFGTERLINIYPTKFTKRLGLSATPERFFDDEGTSAMLTFFNAVKNPTFSFTMAEAIENKNLCTYYYYPRIVNLTDKELQEYIKISKKLVKHFNSKFSEYKDDAITNALLLKRKRIINKAENKLLVFREVFNELIIAHSPVKYTLVYVPEGRQESFNDEDQKLINEYSRVISEEFKISQHQFIGGTKNRTDILKRFANGTIDVLTAMKCLDEGIDVKRTEIAVFCASTSNPRQFIQRRGRLLRPHPDKRFAYIYDIIVVPNIDEDKYAESFEIEKKILISELKRVYEFASLSLNKYQALNQLKEIAENYHIDIFSSEII
jgi:superfamily II DNA or RNA helicase